MSELVKGSSIKCLLGNIEILGCVALDPASREPSIITYPDGVYIPMTEVTCLRLLTGLELTHKTFPLRNFRHWKSVKLGG